MWLNSDTLEESYVRNVYSNLKFRVWRQDMQYASKEKIMAGTQVSLMFSWRKLNLIHGVHTGFYLNFTYLKKHKKQKQRNRMGPKMESYKRFKTQVGQKAEKSS